jgi:RNA polymerase sigma factor (sigma-70 family)
MADGQMSSTLFPSPRAPKEPTDKELLERFALRRDEAAFETLVQRHGPMVLGVCRRLLHDEHAADDAFQATFLVLVRKAGSLAKPELLGNWLYGVAYRIAMKAKVNAARRYAHERQVAPMTQADPMLDVTWKELRSVLDAEMSSLPEKYRAPLVLCYLEGKTNEEAAHLLGWPTGSMSYVLKRGREMLRKRLFHRGVVVVIPLLHECLSRHGAEAAPPALVNATVRAACAAAGRKSLSTLAAASTGPIGLLGTHLIRNGVEAAPPTLADAAVQTFAATVDHPAGSAGCQVSPPPAPAGAKTGTLARSRPVRSSGLLASVVALAGSVVTTLPRLAGYLIQGLVGSGLKSSSLSMRLFVLILFLWSAGLTTGYMVYRKACKRNLGSYAPAKLKAER